MVRDEVIEVGWGRCCGSFMLRRFLHLFCRQQGGCERCYKEGEEGARADSTEETKLVVMQRLNLCKVPVWKVVAIIQRREDENLRQWRWKREGGLALGKNQLDLVVYWIWEVE